MKEFQYVVKDPIGLHARPAGLLVKLAAGYQSKITISGNGKSADSKKLIMLMSLGIKQGTEVSCRVEGEDEEAAAQALQKFFTDNL
ncbi:MAG: HPr family phosphocarrier protein [Lachnospiraceae bacterium]|nr:HPr family phosphocarrier protein [Lachnospiraceae bacterium]MBD5455112.1 HPr family phosphocarrier protein [Lachnospiraceae bacterium]